MKDSFIRRIRKGMALIFFVSFPIITLNNLYAGTNDIILSETYPITHQDYNYNNQLPVSPNHPWNSDYTRIMILEQTRTDLSSAPIGRGQIWGFISDMRAKANEPRAEYEAVTKSVFPTSRSNYATQTEWSIHADEPNIIYALKKTTKQVVKINVDKNSEENVTSYDPGDGTNVSNPAFVEWTSDNLLIVNFNAYAWSSGGYLVNVKTGTKERYYGWPGFCNTNSPRFKPYNISAIHDARSLDAKIRVRYSASGANYDNGAYISDVTDPNCNSGDYYVCTSEGPGGSNCPDYPDPNPYLITHVSWVSNDDWFIGANMGDYWTGGHRNTDAPPYISNYQLVQVIFDRNTHQFTQRVLLTEESAGFRKTSYGDGDANYTGGIPSPSLRRDNAQFVFLSTGGKYSLEDYNYCNIYPGQSICSTVNIASNRSGYRVYLADLSFASSAQACTSFTYTAWSECQPNSTQTRTVTSSSPSGCSGGTPVLEQSCSYTGTSLHNLLKATSTPVIDGNLGEYALAESLSFSPSSGGNTVTVKTLWDSEALYFGITATDTQLNASVTTRDGSVWSEDAIEWFIDTYNDGGSSDPNSPYMRPDDYQGIVNIINGKYDSQGTVSGAPTSTWNGSWQSAVKLNGTNNNNADTDSGYTIEIKIPWTSIGYSMPPSADTIVGMSFAIDDKDSSSFSNLMWPDLLVANQNASNWQKVTLSGSFAVVDSTPPAPPMSLISQ